MILRPYEVRVYLVPVYDTYVHITLLALASPKRLVLLRTEGSIYILNNEPIRYSP